MLKGTLPKFSPASRPQTPEDDKSRRPILSLARSPHLPSPRLTAFALLFLLFLYFILSSTAPAALTTGAARFPSKGEPRNWGDYVGQGLARAKLLAETPPRYADLSDRYHSGSKGPFYRGRTSELQKPAPIPKAVAASIEGKKSKKAAAAVAAVPAADSGSLGDFETERRGVLGGASREWSTGVVGMGDWLGGTVDMRKLPLPVGESTASDKSARAGLAAHILESAWTFKDAEDEANTNALLTDARLNNFLETLPLRDRVRDDPAASAKAAEMWSSVYGALEGDSTKSALEVAIEKLVRRVPVVIFSKVTCPHSRRAKALFAKYTLSHEPYIVEVDRRPDGAELKKLLNRRTLHNTFPNIVIGSRSIGGSEELEELEKSGELEMVLKDAGVTIESKV